MTKGEIDTSPKSFFVRDLLAQSLLLLPEFRRELGAEIFHLKNRSNFDFGFAGHRIWAAFYPLDRFFHRPHLPNPEAGNQLFGFGERPIRHGPGLSRETDALAL